MKRQLILTILLTLPLALSACGGAKETLGLTRQAPDEFAVLSRAPLEVPPSFDLPTPQPGAPRPQEQAASEQAQDALFGTVRRQQSQISSISSDAFLNRLGAPQSDPAIRQKLSEDQARTSPDTPVTEKLFGIVWDEEPGGSAIDAREEAARLQALGINVPQPPAQEGQ